MVLCAAVTVCAAWASHRHRQLLATSMLLCVAVGLMGTALCLHERRIQTVEWPDRATTWSAICLSEPKETKRAVAVDILTSGGKVRLVMPKTAHNRALQPGISLCFRACVAPVGKGTLLSKDYALYLLTHNYTGTAYCKTWTAARNAPNVTVDLGERLRLRCLMWRHRLLQRYEGLGLEENDLAVLQAMTLGEKNRLTAELRNDYSATGASHVLALSGLHLGIVACLLLRWVRQRKILLPAALLTIAVVWTFALTAGLPASVVRAAIMVSVYVVVQVGWRRPSAMNSLALAAILMLVAEPLALIDVGFQLSFLSVAAIVLTGMLLGHNRWETLWVPIAAQTATAPLVAYYFGRLPVYFLLVNMLVVPVTSAILVIGLVTLLLWPLAGLTQPVLYWLLRVQNVGIAHIASWPGACIEGLHPKPLTVAMMYVLLVLVCLTAFYLKKCFTQRPSFRSMRSPWR